MPLGTERATGVDDRDILSKEKRTKPLQNDQKTGGKASRRGHES